MSEYEGQPIRDMNPFSNNRPRLTASERIKNKRDATIYQAEKLRFQNSKKKCGNQNVRFYKNGKIKSMKSYKLQKSLARGNILCNDCDDKGNLCAPPSGKDDLATIYMGNNSYSESWGGSGLEWDGTNFIQTGSRTVINSDINGIWGGSITDISKSLIGPDASTNNIPIPYGYINNLMKVPRNLDGSGIVIDPLNILFPDELCDPFRYLQSSYLKTFIVLTMAVPVIPFASGEGIRGQPATCDNSLNQILVNSFITLQSLGGGSASWFASGEVRSLCCVGTFNLLKPHPNPGLPDINPGTFGLFDVYINLFNINNWSSFNTMLNDTYELADDGTSNWKMLEAWDIVFKQGDFESTIPFAFVRKTRIIQGSIPPSQNQTKYNATEQSYMSCLENGTKNINFTKQNTRIPVKNSFCTPLPPCVSVVTFTINLTSGPSLPSFVSLSDGKYLLFDIDSNIDATWNFNIIDITDSCNGKLTKMKVDYLVVGGGGSGGGFDGWNPPYTQNGTTGGGGGGQVLTGSTTIDTSGNIVVTVGAGSPGTAIAASFNYADRRTQDASNSILTIDGGTIADASGGYNGDFTTFPIYTISPPPNFLGATAGGDSADASGGFIIDPSNNTPIDGSGNPIVYGSGGGAGGGINNGSSNGDPINIILSSPVEFYSSGGDGGDGKASTITGVQEFYGGGGGGGCWQGVGGTLPLPVAGNGGSGGGGNGAQATTSEGSQQGNNADSYGGGGGGCVYLQPDNKILGGAGYRGVVILKFYNAPV